MKKIIMFLSMVLLLLPIGFGLDGEWTQYQYNDYRSGLIEDLSAWFVSGDNQYTDNYTVFPITVESGSGALFELLTADMDNDSGMEIATSSGNFFQIFQANKTTGLVPQEEYNTGAAQTSNGQLIDVDENDFINYIGVFGDTIYNFEWNGSQILLIHNLSIDSCVSGVACKKINNDYSCFFGSDDGNLTLYYPNNNTALVYDIRSSGTGDNFDVTKGETKSPSIVDMNNDGVEELLIVFSDNGGSSDALMNINLKDFNTSWYVQNTNNGNYMNYVIDNLDNIGGSEVCIVSDGTTERFLDCFKSDGSAYSSVSVADAGLSVIFSDLVLADVEGTGEKLICLFESRNSYTFNSNKIKCYNPFEMVLGLTYMEDSGFNFSVSPSSQLSAADLNNDGEDDFILGKYFYISHYLGFGNWNEYELKSTLPDLNLFSIPTDVDGDGRLDICGQYDGGMFCSFDNHTNTPPVVTNLYWDTGTPVCINQLVTYSIDYTDAESDKAQLSIDGFGNNSFSAYSTLSYSPTISFNYTKLGSFTTEILTKDSSGSLGNNVTHTISVKISDCYHTGSGGSSTTIDTTTSGFNDYGLNISKYRLGSDVDGYSSEVFDWLGTGCNEWGVLRGICPAWIWFTVGIGDFWGWLWSNFFIILGLILLIAILGVVFVLFMKRRS